MGNLTLPKPTNETQKPLSPRQRAALAGFGKYASGTAGTVFGSAELISERRQEAAHEIQHEGIYECSAAIRARSEAK